MIKLKNTALVAATLIWGFSFNTFGAEEGKDITKDVERNLETGRQIEAAKEKEAMRDKSHDGRVKVDKDTSVGGKIKDGGGEVNVKKTY